MLQITTHDNPVAMTFEVESNPMGRKSTSLIGPAALAVEAFFGSPRRTAAHWRFCPPRRSS